MTRTGAADRGRRRWLAWGCAHCALLAGVARAQDDWTMPPRHVRPERGSDEGGLWALMDREEVRLRRSSFVVRDAGWSAYVDALACRLAGDHCPDMRVYTVRTPLFNASMAPNGMMQVWTGLLLRLDNGAQLAAVLGHEIGHYVQRHSIARLRDAQSKSAFAALMAPFGLVGLVGQIGSLASLQAFSREHEREADRIGMALLQRTRFDGREAARVWANLRAELSAGAGGDPAQRNVMFATHPGIEERQAALERMGEGVEGDRDETEFRARLEPMMPALIDDELKRAQYDESIVLFGRLSQTRALRGDLRWALGEARRLRGKDDDLAQAQADFESALALGNAPAQTHRSLGFVHRRQDRKDEAARAFQRYLEVLPDAPDAGIVQSYLTELKP